VIVASALSIYTVTIQDATDTLIVSTRKSEPTEILQEASLTLGDDDLLDISAFTEGVDSTLTIYRACGAILVDGNKEQVIIACKDVEYTLVQNNVLITANDTVSFALDEPVSEGMTITIVRAFGVQVLADGQTTQLDILPGTVLNAVEKAGVTLGDDDETIPTPDTALAAGMDIEVLRVSYEQRTENEAIKFSKIVKKSWEMYLGDSERVQNGADGEKSLLYSDRYVNGEFEKSELVSETVIKKAVSQVTLVGTIIKVSTIKFKSGISPISNLTMPSTIKLSENGIPLTYSKYIDGTAKAYYGGGTTSTGLPAKVGYIAVDPKQIPYGTKLYVVSLDGKYIYGYCIAADTGGFVQTNGCTVDLYMNTYNECCQWGYRGVRIYVLD
jgi:uncharacterized protein YabE (DUF348 family)/3D (Asp-Asp-Asp) domain-containing protein